jgi:predicted nucleic acid-binding protein
VAETEEPVEAVADAGPLLHLDELEALDLLVDFPEVLIPAAVRREVLHHRPRLLNHLPPSHRFVEPSLPADPAILQLFQLFSLDSGERETLSAALAAPGSLLLDDAAARLAAKGLGGPRLRYPRSTAA